jgi:low affinity Fe/Cu permease
VLQEILPIKLLIVVVVPQGVKNRSGYMMKIKKDHIISSSNVEETHLAAACRGVAGCEDS